MHSKIVLHQGAIKIEFAHNYKRIRHNTKIRIQPAHFSKTKLILKSSGIEDYKDLNQRLLEKRDEVDSAIKKDLAQHGDIDIDRVKAILNGEVNSEQELNLNSQELLLKTVWDEFMASKRNAAKNSIRTFNILGNIFEDFNVEQKKKQPWKIGDVNEKWLNDFVDYSRTRWSTNTASKRFKTFRQFWKWAVKAGKATDVPHLHTIKFQSFKPDFFTMSNDEIKKLNESPQSDHLENVRKIFLVLIYTGMRYSDYYTLEPHHWHTGKIDKISIKTKVRFIVDIHPNIRPFFEEGLPKLEQQTFNREVKDLCERLEFNEWIKFRKDVNLYEEGPKHSMVSSHVGRHTFCTRALIAGVPHNIIMGWCGWSSPDMLFYYAEKLNLQTANYINALP